MGENTSIQIKKSTKNLLRAYSSRLRISYDELLRKLLGGQSSLGEIEEHYQAFYFDERIPLEEVQEKLGLRKL